MLQYFDQLFPSMSMMIAAKSLNLTLRTDIKVSARKASRSGGSRSALDRANVYVLLQDRQAPEQHRVVLRRRERQDPDRRTTGRADRRDGAGPGASQVTPSRRRCRWASAFGRRSAGHSAVAPAWAHWWRCCSSCWSPPALSSAPLPVALDLG